MADFPSVASASGIIEVNAADDSALTTSDLQKIDALATALDNDHIASVRSVTTSPLFLAKNQKMQLIQVAMDGQPGEDGPNAAVKTLRADTEAFLRARACADSSPGVPLSRSIRLRPSTGPRRSSPSPRCC